jgi:hypothetical protein
VECLSQDPRRGVEVASLQHLGSLNSIQRIIARNKSLFVEKPKEYRLGVGVGANNNNEVAMRS